VNDFETVRDWLLEFPQDEPHAALDRIEAEVERLRATRKVDEQALEDAAKRALRLEMQNRDAALEVERLRSVEQHVEWLESQNVRFRSENERLQAAIERHVRRCRTGMYDGLRAALAKEEEEEEEEGRPLTPMEIWEWEKP
jgi:hypothetical protein